MLTEKESAALESRVAGARLVASAISHVEVTRAVRRVVDDPAATTVLDDVWDRFVVLGVNRSVLDAAARVAPAALRTLDAIHLASALGLADELDAFLTYDRQLGAAASQAGLPVEAPR